MTVIWNGCRVYCYSSSSLYWAAAVWQTERQAVGEIVHCYGEMDAVQCRMKTWARRMSGNGIRRRHVAAKGWMVGRCVLWMRERWYGNEGSGGMKRRMRTILNFVNEQRFRENNYFRRSETLCGWNIIMSSGSDLHIDLMFSRIFDSGSRYNTRFN